jgi:hypothetical protein
MKEPSIQRTAIALMGCKRFSLFILNLIIPYGYIARYLLLQACKQKSTIVVRMVEGGFFHSSLRVLSPEERLIINTAYSDLKKNRPVQDTSDPFFINGYKFVGKLISQEECESVVSYLKKEKGFAGQVPMQSDGILYSYDEAESTARQHGRYFSYAPSISLKNPIISRLVEHEQIKNMVREKLGDNAEIYSANTFVVFPGETLDHYVMKMHRDYDDFNFIAFFVYWTGVTSTNGAALFVPKTNMSSDNHLMEHKLFLEGTPGDVFALDSFGYHAGNNSVKSPRFVTWFRYGLRNNLASIQDGWPLSEVKQLCKA